MYSLHDETKSALAKLMHPSFPGNDTTEDQAWQVDLECVVETEEGVADDEFEQFSIEDAVRNMSSFINNQNTPSDESILSTFRCLVHHISRYDEHEHVFTSVEV